MKIIQSDFNNHNQSWSYTQIVEKEGKKLRVRIRRNAFDNQSHALAELWAGTEWRQVISRPIEVMECRNVSYVLPLLHEDVCSFKQDTENLLKMAFEVVG